MGGGGEGVRLKWKVTLFQVIIFFMEKVVDLDSKKSVLTKINAKNVLLSYLNQLKD